MKARFQADADFSHRIVSAVRRREPAIDFQSANVLNLRGLDDPEVLALAAQEGRVLVSHDLTTMPDHFREVRRDQHQHRFAYHPSKRFDPPRPRRDRSSLDRNRRQRVDKSNASCVRL